MSTAELPPRPRQLWLAAGVVIGGSAILVAAVLDAIGNLESVDTRNQLREAVSSSAGKDLGVTLDQAIDAMRAALSVTAACAAVALVLGIFVLQRHKGARVALSVVAVPLLVTAPLVGGFLGALVALATVMLWNGQAGDWYAGRPIREPAARRGVERQERSSLPSGPPPPANPTAPPAGAPPVGEPHDVPSTRETSTTPGATQGFGSAAPEPQAPSPTSPYGTPWSEHGTQLPGPAGPAGRAGSTVASVPTPVRIACLLTWTFSGSVALMYLAGVVAMIVDRGAIVDRVTDSAAWSDSGLSDDALVPLLWFGVLLFLAWSVGAVVLAYFTWRRHDWARYLLAVSAALALLVGAIAFPVGILHQLACAATIGTLFAPRSRLWFSRRATSSGPRQGPPPPPPPVRGGPW